MEHVASIGKMINAYKIFKGWNYLGDRGLYWRIILKLFLKKVGF
jgi:hypothetical protein